MPARSGACFICSHSRHVLAACLSEGQARNQNAGNDQASKPAGAARWSDEDLSAPNERKPAPAFLNKVASAIAPSLTGH
jgi:hypothetical protein